MSKEKMIERIKNLLELANNKGANEFEAQDALLKAQRLMIKYKIEESDVNADSINKNVVRKYTGVTMTARTGRWKSTLAKVIASNFLCKFHLSQDRTQYEIVFTGFEDDTEICTATFKYAVDCVESALKLIKKKYTVPKGSPAWNMGVRYSSEEIKSYMLTYAMAFSKGLEVLFDEQKNKENWGLVVQTPQEVEDAYNALQLHKKQWRGQSYKHSGSTYESGYSAGKSFSMSDKLRG